MERKPIVTVTRKDLRRQTFTVRGPGGGGKDTSNTGVRLIHDPSGAVGEGREERSQVQNEIAAFKRLTARPEFQRWIKVETCRKLAIRVPETPEEIRERVDKMVDEALVSGQILVEDVTA